MLRSRSRHCRSILLKIGGDVYKRQVQDADNIIVLSSGKIAEQGSHSDLMKKNGVYAAMWTDYQRSAQWKVGRERRNPAGGYLDAQKTGQERGNPTRGYLDAQNAGQERGKEAAV